MRKAAVYSPASPNRKPSSVLKLEKKENVEGQDENGEENGKSGLISNPKALSLAKKLMSNQNLELDI